MLLAIMVGQHYQHQPAGRFTSALIQAAAAHCPAAIDPLHEYRSVADGAHLLDVWAWRIAMDAMLGGERCRRLGAEAMMITWLRVS